MHLRGGHFEGDDSHRQQADVSHETRQPNVDPLNMENSRRLPDATEQHQSDDAGQQQEVDAAVKADAVGVRRRVHWQHPLPPVIPGIEGAKHGQ